MNTNKICARISFVIIILLGGTGLIISGTVSSFLAPLAVCILPSETAEAHYTDPYISYQYRVPNAGPPKPQVEYFRSHIAYAGHATELITTKCPTPLDKPWQGFTVRFVRAFPSLVLPENPNSSLWEYYRDTWTIGGFIGFLFGVGIVFAALFFLLRDLWHSRRRGRWS